MLELTIRLVASLAVVLGLLLVLAKLAGRRFRSGPGAAVRVLHRQPLTRSSAVSVIGIGSRVFVVGSTDHQVNLLTELDPDEVEWSPAGELDAEPGADGALGVLAATLSPRRGRGGSHRAPDQPDQPGPSQPPSVAEGDGALAGSVLSAQTWRQAFAAATRRAS